MFHLDRCSLQVERWLQVFSIDLRFRAIYMFTIEIFVGSSVRGFYEKMPKYLLGPHMVALINIFRTDSQQIQLLNTCFHV